MEDYPQGEMVMPCKVMNNILVSSMPNTPCHHWPGVRDNDVDQPCFINPVEWINGLGL
jgi:hypothetical protein